MLPQHNEEYSEVMREAWPAVSVGVEKVEEEQGGGGGVEGRLQLLLLRQGEHKNWSELQPGNCNIQGSASVCGSTLLPS